MRTFDYIYGAYLGELILSHSDNLSKTLQSPKLSAVQGQDCANKTVLTLEKIRNDDDYELFWSTVVAKAEKLGADDPKLPEDVKLLKRRRICTVNIIMKPLIS